MGSLVDHGGIASGAALVIWEMRAVVVHSADSRGIARLIACCGRCLRGLVDCRAPMRPLKIVAFGDSLTAGYGSAGQDAFPAKLEAALKAKGVAMSRSRMPACPATPRRADCRGSTGRCRTAPTAVILELGANDMLRGVDPEGDAQALDDDLAKLKARNIAVLSVRHAGGAQYGRGLSRARSRRSFPELAEKYDIVFYPFFLDGVAAQAKFALRDGMHPNAAGVDRRSLPAYCRKSKS